MGLADGDQGDAVRRAAGCPRGRLDPLPDGGEIGRDNLFHSSSIPGKDRSMSVVHYRLSVAFAASLSLALAACAASPPAEQPAQQSGGPPGSTNAQKAASGEPEEIDTEANILTILGLAKKEAVKDPGPQTGRAGCAVAQQAPQRTAGFVT